MPVIYQTFSQGDADFRTAIVHESGRADLLVYLVTSRGWANGEGNWFITRNYEEKSLKLYFGDIGQAQFTVCFVTARSRAGWQRAHRLRGRLR